MRFLLLILSLIFSLGLTGCSAYQPTVDVKVKVQRNKELGTWKVSYESDRGFQTLNFARQRYKLRSQSWKILTSGVRLEDTGQAERITSDKPINKFEAEFDGRQAGTANDYPIVSHYSDGGVVLYTGHLLLEVPDCAGCKVNHSFEYIPSEGENVITEENEGQLGDFVYFGDGVVTEFDSFRAVTDRGLPDWIQRQMERSLPNFINLYQEKLGFALPKKPLVFAAYDKGLAVREEGYVGGVVGSHMQLVLVGSKWAEPDGIRYEKFAHLIAHEVFHFWNVALFLASDRVGGSWLHEGGADAVADFSLYQLGYYGSERYSEIQTERLNRCMLGLSMRSLPQSDEHGYYKNFYECGAVMNHLLARKFAPEFTLFDFWRNLFQTSESSFYSQDKFFKVAQPLLADPNALEAVRAVAAGNTGEPSQFFKTAFDQLGIHYSTASSGFPLWYEEIASKNVVALLAQRDCGESVSVDIGESGIFVEGSERCSTLKSTHELRNISGYTIPSSGAEAHDALFNQCTSNPVAAVYDSAGQGYVTSCHDFPKRPDYLIW